MYGLTNMSLFLFLINYIIALIGVQLLRGDVAVGDDDGNDRFINWGEIYNAFLGIYQVFSSENWTDVLYDAATSEVALRQTAIVVLFLVGWFFFANCKLWLPITWFPCSRSVARYRVADVHCCDQREL